MTVSYKDLSNIDSWQGFFPNFGVEGAEEGSKTTGTRGE
jgi:hypothetical protein